MGRNWRLTPGKAFAVAVDTSDGLRVGLALETRRGDIDAEVLLLELQKFLFANRYDDERPYPRQYYHSRLKLYVRKRWPGRELHITLTTLEM